jgi:acyl-CoA reductase-like NAD-dependent aldehyde dehydrogenase
MNIVDPIVTGAPGNGVALLKLVATRDAGRAASAALSAAVEWQRLAPRDRARYVRALRHAIVNRQDEIVAAVRADTGKPAFEVLAQEVAAALEVIRYAERRVPRWLRPRRFWYPRPGFWTKWGEVRYEAIGPVAVVGPASFPFSLPVMQAAYALLCGNAVLLKPSERAPETGRVLQSVLEDAGFPAGVVSVVEGGPEAARALIGDERVRKVFFTGSSEAGRAVAELCGRHFKPCVLELGGETAAIVCADADVERAAAGIAWSAFYAAGQSCIGVRRAFVEAGAWEALLRALDAEVRQIPQCDLADGLSVGSYDESATTHRFVLHDATRMVATSGEDLSGARTVLTVTRVEAADEAVSRANASPDALGAAVWSRDIRRARALAAELDAGLVWINDASVGQPQLPWGGSGASGWGRVFSRHGLSEFVHMKAVTVDRPAGRRKPWWFPYSSRRAALLRRVNRVLYVSWPLWSGRS